MTTVFRNRSMAARASLALAIAASLPVFAVAPETARAAVDIGISVNFAPPPLPVYEQPLMPGPGYIWTPGYWAYDPLDGYYWVPGTWIRPPYYGALWTPGYWGWREGVYVFNRGYWGRRVGYYGGINYGYGYGGRGYEGGYWRGRSFYYNRAANNINVNLRITNVYNRTIVNNVTVNRFSFNGPGGANLRPTSVEIAYERQKHTPPVADQVRQRDAARNDKSLRASENKGQPPVAATEKPGVIARPAGSQDTANMGRGNNQGAIDKAGAGAKNGKGVQGNAAASGAGISANADAGARMAKGGKRGQHPAAGAAGNSAQDNGNAMNAAAASGLGQQQPKRHAQVRGNPRQPAMGSPQQHGPMRMGGQGPDRGQGMDYRMQQHGQGQQPRVNDRRQGQPRPDRGQHPDGKPREKDHNPGNGGG